jgi:hypothetical protein
MKMSQYRFSCIIFIHQQCYIQGRKISQSIAKTELTNHNSHFGGKHGECADYMRKVNKCITIKHMPVIFVRNSSMLFVLKSIFLYLNYFSFSQNFISICRLLFTIWKKVMPISLRKTLFVSLEKWKKCVKRIKNFKWGEEPWRIHFSL